LKISFPLGLSFHALLQVTSFSAKSPDKSIFEIIQPGNNLDNSNKFDENYATDFYTRYYIEKNMPRNKNFMDDSDFDRSSELGKIIVKYIRKRKEDI